MDAVSVLMVLWPICLWACPLRGQQPDWLEKVRATSGLRLQLYEAGLDWREPRFPSVWPEPSFPGTNKPSGII